MTNREMMVGLLQDDAFVDDGGASYEAMLCRNIECPYEYGDDRAECCDDGELVEELICRDNCVRCKEQWLDDEVDV